MFRSRTTVACLSDGGMSMNIIDFIPFGKENAITREQLRMITGMPDRKMRDLISEAREEWPILNLQTGDGYYMPKEDRLSEIAEVKKWLKQEGNREKSINKTQRGAMIFLHKIEQKLKKEIIGFVKLK